MSAVEDGGGGAEIRRVVGDPPASHVEARNMTLHVSVVVPSWRRPVDLARCLVGLSRQTRVADEVVVVRRDDDLPTAQVVARAPLHVVEAVSTRPGVSAALVAGVLKASGDVIAFTDDDAVPRPDWLERILGRLSDSTIGAAGGRDWIHNGEATDVPPTEAIGHLSAWGRLVGNHHLGTGPPREVTYLKGVNMAFRRQALALPLEYRGRGAQPNWEVAVCLWAGARGWRIVYDPAIIVDHFPGERQDGDRRGARDSDVVRAVAYNLVGAILVSRPEMFWRRALFGLLVGQSDVPGLLRAAVAVPRREWGIVRLLPGSLWGQVGALKAAAGGRHLSMVEFPAPPFAVTPQRRSCSKQLSGGGQRGWEERAADAVRTG